MPTNQGDTNNAGKHEPNEFIQKIMGVVRDQSIPRARMNRRGTSGTPDGTDQKDREPTGERRH
jgi:hypothetical protein